MSAWHRRKIDRRAGFVRTVNATDHASPKRLDLLAVGTAEKRPRVEFHVFIRHTLEPE